MQELELSRLKHDKLSQMLAAASAAQQAADQKSRRLEIRFARSNKGHALMRSAKLQASVTDLEAQVSQLQGNCHHQVRRVVSQGLLADTSFCDPASSHGIQSLQADISFCSHASSHGIHSLQADISFCDPASSHAVGRPGGHAVPAE